MTITQRRLSIVKKVTVLLGVALFALAVPAHAQQTPASLFEPATAPASGDQRLGVSATDVQYVRARLDALGSLEGPPDRADRTNSVRLDVFDKGSFVASMDRLEQLSSGRYAWTGRIQDEALGSVTMIVDREAGTITGTISFADGTYQILPRAGGLHAVVKLDPAGDRGDAHIDAPPADMPKDLPPTVMGDNGSRIDVMVVYTPAARIAAGTANISALIDLAVSETNQGYANSGITPRLRLVHKTEVAYDEVGDFSTDLNRLAATNDGFLDTVHGLRNQYGADMVSMIIEGSAYCGIGFLGGPSANSSIGFQVTARNCATGYYSFGHEFGHVQGAKHDWFVEEPPDNSPYAYNHGHYSVSGLWRDVMSYANGCTASGVNCTRINYWSNPGLTYGGQPLGIPVGSFHPTDNRLTLNNTAFTVANWRQEISPIPGAATLVSPLATTSSANPTYTWNVVSSATAYYLWVRNTATSAALVQIWYNAAAICGVSTCSVTPSAALTAGQAYTWSIQTWNVTGYGPWSAGAALTLPLPPPPQPPAAATLRSPAGALAANPATFSWYAVPAATHYYLWVNDSSGTRIQTWYSSSSAGCGMGSGSCAVSPGVTLAGGGVWWIQTWNATGGFGPWSTGSSYTVPAPATLSAPLLVAPGGTLPSGAPSGTFLWRPVTGATHYYLWVNDNSGAKIQRWYQVSEAGCANGVALCSGGLVEGQNLNTGTITWWVQAWSAALGYGPWGAGLSFQK